MLDKHSPVNIVVRFRHLFYIKGTFSFHKLIPNNDQMSTLYTNLSLYTTFTMIYDIRQE